MLLFGCLLAFAAAAAPRLVLILAWIFSDRWSVVWSNWLVPLVGIIFAPYTTIMYLLVWSPAGLQGFDWVWLGLGVVLDIMKWGQIVNNRKGVPGYSRAYPGQVPAAAYEAEIPRQTAQAVPAASPSTPTAVPAEQVDYTAELESLARLRDQGVLTDEEFEAKKRQLLGE